MYVLFIQTIKMLIYMGIGFLLSRLSVIKKGESRVPAQLLLYVVLPCAIINSFNLQRSEGGLSSLTHSIICAAAAVLISMAISAIFFRKDPIANFSSSFSNAGFMGIPLITSILGGDKVFYVAAMVALLNALQWTYGQAILSKDHPRSIGGIIKNPMVIAFFAGIVIFFLPFRLPELLSQCISGAAACNTPLAMIVLGLYLGDSDLRTIFASKTTYLASIVRLIIIPLATIAVLKLMPFAAHEVKMAVFIAACAPAGSNVAVYAQKLRLDYTYAVSMVCCSTILSVLSMPLMIALGEKLI